MRPETCNLQMSDCTMRVQPKAVVIGYHGLIVGYRNYGLITTIPIGKYA